MKKKIDHILTAKQKQIMPGEYVLQPLPHMDFRFANPFIVIHHQVPANVTAGSQFRIHPHPHRGFSPVTFMLQGEGYHKDNAGHDEIIKAGDVQWMFAGKGILHSEGPTHYLLENGGTTELIQIWVNVPKANKWDEPFYQSAVREQQPQVLQQDGVDLRLASGHFDNKTGPLKSHTPVISVVGKIDNGKQVQLAAIANYWTLIYVAKGSLNINQETIQQHQLVVFEKDNEEIVLTALEDAVILFLSAEPIDEPVAAKDNFVMNTQQEAEQAIADYKNGVFGHLEY